MAAWPIAEPVATAHLQLEPLRVEYVPECFSVFNDMRLHVWTGCSPYSREELEARYQRLSAGQSPDGTRGWLNWMLRRFSDGQLVGTVQATLRRPSSCQLEAELAWVVGFEYQGNGYGREGALAMVGWLRAHGANMFIAHIHPEHEASIGVAQALGLTATNIASDGEVRWSTA